MQQGYLIDNRVDNHGGFQDRGSTIESGMRCQRFALFASLLGQPTPGLTSATAVEDPAPLASAVTTSRRELPVVAVAPTRRVFPLMLFVEIVPAFSLVLEASDRESSAGGGRDLAGGIIVDERGLCLWLCL